MNGCLMRMEEPMIPVEDRGFQFTDGVDEAISVDHGHAMERAVSDLFRVMGGTILTAPRCMG